MLKNKMEKLNQHIKSQVKISDSAIKLILGEFSEKYYNKKEHLLHFDNISNYDFFVASGCVRTYIADYYGVEHNIYFSIENW
jgi:hypothetical protein